MNFTYYCHIAGKEGLFYFTFIVFSYTFRNKSRLIFLSLHKKLVRIHVSRFRKGRNNLVLNVYTAINKTWEQSHVYSSKILLRIAVYKIHFFKYLIFIFTHCLCLIHNVNVYSRAYVSYTVLECYITALL